MDRDTVSNESLERMLKPKRRLFRRRENGEWIKANTYVGVTLLALVGGAVGWMTLFNEDRPQSRHGPADLAAESTPAAVTAPEPLPAPANERSVAADATLLPSTVDATVPVTAAETRPLPSTTYTTAPVSAETKRSTASTRAAPRAAGGTLEAGGRRMRQWSVNSKSRPVARTSSRVRASSVAAAAGSRHAHVRWARASAKHQMHASVTRARARAHEDYLDRAYVATAPSEGPWPPSDDATRARARAHEEDLNRAYSARAPSERSWPPPQDVASSAGDESERAISPADCSRLSRAFGGSRRIRSECLPDPDTH